jgi:transaldolase
MNALNRLHDLGQSVWLDNIRRELLSSGTLAKWIAELSVTGLTSLLARVAAKMQALRAA